MDGFDGDIVMCAGGRIAAHCSLCTWRSPEYTGAGGAVKALNDHLRAEHSTRPAATYCGTSSTRMEGKSASSAESMNARAELVVPRAMPMFIDLFDLDFGWRKHGPGSG